MPYVKRDRREFYDYRLNQLIDIMRFKEFHAGDATYVIFRILLEWWKHAPGYQTICEIRGMLAGCLSEFDRRQAFPYEDEKIIENGDV